MTSALAGLVVGDEKAQALRAMEGIADPAGTFYRYGMAASLLGSQRKEQA
jgi:hypothetical protein